jgi:hypothetical protein
MQNEIDPNDKKFCKIFYRLDQFRFACTWTWLLECTRGLLFLILCVAGLTKHDASMASFLAKDEVQECTKEGDAPKDDQPEHLPEEGMVVFKDHNGFNNMADDWNKHNNKKKNSIKNAPSV